MVVFFIFLSLILPCTTYEDYRYFKNLRMLTPSRDISYKTYLLENKLLNPEGPRRQGGARKEQSKTKRQDVTKSTLFTNLPEKPDLDMPVFSKLKTEQKDATLTAGSHWSHAWLGRVMHSTDLDEDFLYLCTASCIEKRIFLTAARCIYQARVLFTTVIINGDRLQAIAFVAPIKPTKTMFDDIGFIVVNNTERKWSTVPLYDQKQNANFVRTDDNFFWFTKMSPGGSLSGSAVGYVKEKGKPWNIYETKIYISPFLCQHFYNTDILKQLYKSDYYYVPCYHTCGLVEGYNKYVCNRRLAGEGHAVLSNNKLIGVASWGGYYSTSLLINLPVGVALVNSKPFEKLRRCAQKITKADVTRKSYSDLCKK